MQIKALIDCVVVDLLFKDGDTVKAGDEILITEAMKMMLPYQTDIAGVITYKCKLNDYVSAGTVLAEVI